MAAAASTTEQITTLVAQLGGLAILAGTLAAAAAVVYRWYVREAVPRALSLLVGLSGVALYLNTTTALGQVIAGSSAPTDAERALFNITAFAVAAGGATLGRRAGDQFGTDVVLGEGMTDVDSEVGKLVQSVGRVVTVQLPDDIKDVTGYDPVPEATKEKLAGRTFLFPRRLTVAQLRERLTQRLKTDYAVGHVDVELAEDGSVEYLAVGSRAAGIGPTLPPATNAVAIRADPAFAASAGDLVQVWETDPMRRVLTAELRGVADETVTIAIDAADTPKLNPTKEYRLVTLPVTDRPDREFASLLRAAEETFSSVSVEAGSPLHGLPVGALSLTVISVKPENEEPTALPEPSTILAPGDMVFAVGRPDALRRLETAAEPLDPSLVRRPVPSKHPRDQPRQTEPAQATQPTDQPSADTQPEAAQSAGQETTPDAADATASAGEGIVGEPGGDGAAGESATPATADDAAPPAAGDDSDATATADADGDTEDSGTTGKAGPESFQELKEEFDSGQADWDDDETPEPAEGDVDIDAGSDTAEAGGDQGTSPAAADDPDETATDSGTSGKAGPGSFQELKDEFESGDADWDDGEGTGANGEDSDEDESEASDGAEVAFENDAAADAGFEDDDSLDDLTVGDETETADGDLDGLDFGDESNEESDDEFGDDVDGLLDEEDDGPEDGDDGGFEESADDALSDISFDEDDGDDLDFEDDDDDDLGSLGGEDESSDDDLAALDGEDDGDDDLAALGSEDEATDDGLSLDEDDEEDENADDTEDDDGDDEEDDDDDDSDDDDSGGGGTSFAQLKEEFESGEADWEDDISDSPGGDMRLDE